MKCFVEFAHVIALSDYYCDDDQWLIVNVLDHFLAFTRSSQEHWLTQDVDDVASWLSVVSCKVYM